MNFRRAVEDYRSWGLLRFIHLCVMKLLRRRLTLCGIYARTLSQNPVLPDLPGNRDVRIATMEELTEAGKDPVYDLGSEFIHSAIGKGDMCIALFEDDRLLAYYWRAADKTPHVRGLWAEFGPGYCYNYKAFTHPAFRQQRLQQIVATWSDPLMLQRGFAQSIGFIETHNFASIKSTERRGSRKVGYAGYLQLLGKSFPFRSRGAKRHGFRFFIPSDDSAADR
ncbi:MAG: hypothetical protein WD795_06890 [Woeseia sp.]